MIHPAAVVWPGKVSLESDWETKRATTRKEGAPQAEEEMALPGCLV